MTKNRVVVYWHEAEGGQYFATFDEATKSRKYYNKVWGRGSVRPVETITFDYDDVQELVLKLLK